MSLATLGRLSASYALGGLAYKVVALLSVPILARLLTPAQLGLLDFAAVLATIVALTITVGSDQAIPYQHARRTDVGAVWGTALTIVLSGAVAVALVVGIASEPLAAAVLGDPAHGPVMLVAALYGGAMSISMLALIAVRLHGRPSTYAVVSFFIVLFEMAGAIAVALLVPDPVVPMILAWMAGAAVVAVPVLVRHLSRLRRPSRQLAVRLATFGLPLVPAALAWLVGDAWIRSVLAREATATALGEYGIAHRIASALGLIVTGFGVAWGPYIYRSHGVFVPDRAGRTAVVMVLALGAIGSVLTLAAPEVIALVAGPAYADARLAVAGLCGSMVALGIVVLVSPLAGRSGSTRRVAMAAAAGLLTQVATAIPLVQLMGLAGAALASLMGYSVGALTLLVVTPDLMREGRAARLLAATLSSGVALGLAAAWMGASAQLRVLGAVVLVMLLGGVWIMANGGVRGQPESD